MSNLATIAYLIAAVCFIMALRGLSSPSSARQGNLYAIAGMVIPKLVGSTLRWGWSECVAVVGMVIP